MPTCDPRLPFCLLAQQFVSGVCMSESDSDLASRKNSRPSMVVGPWEGCRCMLVAAAAGCAGPPLLIGWLPPECCAAAGWLWGPTWALSCPSPDGPLPVGTAPTAPSSGVVPAEVGWPDG